MNCLHGSVTPKVVWPVLWIVFLSWYHYSLSFEMVGNCVRSFLSQTLEYLLRGAPVHFSRCFIGGLIYKTLFPLQVQQTVNRTISWYNDEPHLPVMKSHDYFSGGTKPLRNDIVNSILSLRSMSQLLASHHRRALASSSILPVRAPIFNVRFYCKLQ